MSITIHSNFIKITKKMKNIIYITGGIVAFSYPFNFIYELEIKRNFKEFGYNLEKKICTLFTDASSSLNWRSCAI